MNHSRRCENDRGNRCDFATFFLIMEANSARFSRSESLLRSTFLDVIGGHPPRYFPDTLPGSDPNPLPKADLHLPRADRHPNVAAR